MRQRIHSTSRTILAAFLLILITVVGMFAYLAWDEYRRAQIEKDQLVSSRVQMVSTHAEWLVSAGTQTLDVAELILANNFPSVTPDQEAEISRIVDGLPGLASLTLVDLERKTIFSTNNKPDELTVSELQEVLASTIEGRTYISIFNPRKDHQENYFAISRPIMRDGKVQGVARLRFPAKELLSLWSNVNLGPQSTISLVRNDGWLVARYPAPDEAVDLSGYELFTQHLKTADRGVYSTTSPVDEVRRVVAFQRVPDTPLVAIAAASQSYASQPLRKYILSLVTLLAGLLAIGAAVTFWTSNLLAEDDKRKIELARNVERTTLLLGEIHHRVKNNLQAVASLIQLQPMDPDGKRDMRLRIAAMGALHEQSYKLEQFAEVDLQTYLQTLIENAKSSNGQDISIIAELTPMIINRDVALPLGLIVNEVVSNAVKHAFHDQPSPTISVRLERMDESQAEVTIKDNGTGFTPQEKGKGMGSRLIKAFALQIGGTYGFETLNGTTFRMTFPVPQKQP